MLVGATIVLLSEVVFADLVAGDHDGTGWSDLGCAWSQACIEAAEPMVGYHVLQNCHQGSGTQHLVPSRLTQLHL